MWEGGGELIGQNYRTVADWNIAEEGKWVENSLTISGDASSLTGTTAPVAGGELVILSSNFDASCCGGGEAGRVYFDNFRVEVDGEQVYAESFENAGVTEGGEGELADAGGRARTGKLQLGELHGASFTISSLGGIGGQ